MTEVNKTSELNFMSSDSIQPNVYEHKNTVCSNCGSNFTSSGWYKTYNKDGSWDRNRYHCMMCHSYFSPNTGEFSRNPRIYKIHENTVCSNCGSSSTSCWYKKYDDNGSWNKRSYICAVCYKNPAYRSGELNPSSNTYKGMIGVQAVAKVLGDKDCTIMKEGSPFDICSIQSIKYGKIEVKAATYNSKYGYWKVSGIKPGLFDTLFILCTDSKFRNISRVYIIDGIEVGNRKIIAIYRNLYRGGWYEKFRVSSITQYQEAFQIVKNESQISENYVYNGENLLSTKEKGDICEEIVRIAINARTSTDIYYDLIHKEYERIEVKGSDYYSRHERWAVGSIESYKFDSLFIVCMSGDFERINRVYIISKKDVGSVKTITIYRNLSKDGWYEKFRVKDIRPYQEACKRVLSGDIY